MNHRNDALLTPEQRYLLGIMTGKELGDMQERIVSDPDVFDQVCDAENDLVDAFARNELDAPLHQLVATRLAKRLPIAQTWNHLKYSPGLENDRKLKIERGSVVKRKPARLGVFAIAAGILLAVLGIGVWQQRSYPHVVTRDVARLDLTITTRGSGQIAEFVLPANARICIIHVPGIVLESRGRLLDEKNRLVWEGRSKGPGEFPVPRSALQPSTYEFEAGDSAGRPLSYSYFRIR
ncbi:MAG: hypothetical protein H7Y20_02735 [Bryobacteraceae bacterium]|nr:hypothetical protein [Bryobacteraceae bacterium]